MSDDKMLPPRALDRLTGAEPLGNATVADFWRWALGDLRMNTARGYLGEYLVAQALQDASPIRIEWGPWDVTAADGTRVEVKTTGRLQSWALRKLSMPSWSFKSVRTDRVWSETAGDYITVDPSTRVHVWIVAAQTQEDPERYHPLDIDQWTFRVMPHRELLATGQTSATLSFFEARGIAAVRYAGLVAAVADARRRNDDLGGLPRSDGFEFRGKSLAPLLVDAGPLYACVDAEDHHHAASLELLETHPGPLIVPTPRGRVHAAAPTRGEPSRSTPPGIHGPRVTHHESLCKRGL